MRTNSRIESNTFDNLPGIQSVKFGVCIKLIKKRHA